MQDYIRKWPAVNRLIRLENEYQAHKWDAEKLYGGICNAEIEIGKAGIGWIPVTEMVPESHVEQVDDGDDIIYLQISDFVLGYTDKGQFAVVQHEVTDGRDWWIDWNCQDYAVTHWVPLPKPPGGE